MKRFAIRRATREDVAHGIKLGREMHAESLYKDIRFDDDKLIGYLDYLRDNDSLLTLGAWNEDGKPVGFAIFVLSEYWFSKEVYVADLGIFLSKEWRGSSIAPRMIRHAELWAIDRGARELCIGSTTGVKPEAYGKLLKRKGYEHIGDIYKKGLK